MAAIVALLVVAIVASRGGRPTGLGRGSLAPAVDGDFDNLVVVMIDTLRADHLPSYGYERRTAPFLTRLAEQGIQLDGYATSSWTRPSIASFLTGLYPQRHQAIERSDHLPAAAPFLPEILSAHGLHTAGYLSNGNASSAIGFGRGYEWAEDYPGTAKPRAAMITDEGLKLADRLEPPFFLYLHYLDPHDPYTPTRGWDGSSEYLQPQDVLADREQYFNEQGLQRLRDAYDGEIRDMDPELERLVDGLRQRGLLARTLVVVTADHGEAFGEHGDVAHGHSLYSEEVHVPFLLWSDDGRLPHYRDRPFRHVDFVATALSALGLPPPDEGDGVDRWHQILDQELPAEPEMFFHLDLDDRAALGIQEGGLKLIHRLRQPRNVLYDVATDPGEQQPLNGRDEARRRLLRRLVVEHNQLSQDRYERTVEELDTTLREKLAALGYLVASTPLEKLSNRNLPPRLSLYDTRVFGLFGTERPAQMTPRLEAAAGSTEQWLSGWSSVGPEGATAVREASVVLPFDGRSDTLAVEGHAEGRTRLSVRIGDRHAGDWPVGPGAFTVAAEIVGPAADRAPFLFIDLATEEPSNLVVDRFVLQRDGRNREAARR